MKNDLKIHLVKKRLHVMLLLFAGLVIGAVTIAGCTPSQSASLNNGKVSLEYPDAISLLDAIWNQVPEQDKTMIVGGIGSTARENTPAAMPMEEPEILAPTLAVPEKLVLESRSSACIRQAMLANDFTVTVWQLNDDQDMARLARQCQEHLANNPWLDTIPEEFDVLWQGDFMVICYGQKAWVNSFVDATSSIMKEPQVLFGRMDS